MPGPDFPTGGIVVEPPEAIREAYETGRGGFRVRARWETEKLKARLEYVRDKHGDPHTVSGAVTEHTLVLTRPESTASVS